MFNLPKEIIIWDSEFTSWSGTDERGWTGSDEIKELVQIGAVRVKTADWTKLSSFEVLIRPVVNPILSDYFIKLTGISQAEIDKNGTPFKNAYQMFFDWVGSANLYSWNLCDYWALAETCKLNNMVLPIKRNRFFDMLMVFWKAGILAENYHSGTITEAFGQKSKYQRHKAINDAQTILDGLRLLSRR